jgi:hypothetical protein
MHNFALVVLSCDRYVDLWDGFFHQLYINLDIPIKKYLISNFLQYQGSNAEQIQTICVGKENNWSETLQKALSLIKEEKIFVLVEDCFIDKKIDSESFIKHFNFAFAQNAQLIQLEYTPDSEPCGHQDYFHCPAGMPYLIGVCGIWDKKYLTSLLLPGENPWQFEINGSYRAQFSAQRVYCPREPLLRYRNIVQKGAWVATNVRWARQNGISLKTELRPFQISFFPLLKYVYFKAFQYLPWRIRVRILNAWRKILLCY